MNIILTGRSRGSPRHTLLRGTLFGSPWHTQRVPFHAQRLRWLFRSAHIGRNTSCDQSIDGRVVSRFRWPLAFDLKRQCHGIVHGLDLQSSVAASCTSMKTQTVLATGNSRAASYGASRFDSRSGHVPAGRGHCAIESTVGLSRTILALPLSPSLSLSLPGSRSLSYFSFCSQGVFV